MDNTPNSTRDEIDLVELFPILWQGRLSLAVAIGFAFCVGLFMDAQKGADFSTTIRLELELDAPVFKVGDRERPLNSFILLRPSPVGMR